ncbi:chitobiase/beta-hexosaminidase C-terminal domain-containing protein [Acidicapsa acidisoli]|uniref:chitobiase/beta-hexosaminidase C-terminal domain-containing protein n=1 Tax=Acidicapsa acidisoli TaxID=1615681 RepID=UPI0021DF9641|nr:chitobiase/beta-hexosaminidase C-terminal domain-containing protein [Acidicapsa acidisoli]
MLILIGVGPCCVGQTTVVARGKAGSYPAPPPASTRAFSLASGTYTGAQLVSIADATLGATIYYTTDGSTPTKSSTVYTGPITVATSETLKAIAIAPGYNNSAVATASYVIVPPAPDFSVAVSSGSLTVVAGRSTKTNLSITPENGFNSAVSFSCSGLPSGATCVFSPATVTPSGAAASTTTLTVSAAALTAELRHGRGLWISSSGLAVALCCLGRRRRRLPMLLLLAASVAGLSGMVGCGSSTTLKPLTSVVVVTATAGSLQHAATLSLTVY